MVNNGNNNGNSSSSNNNNSSDNGLFNTILHRTSSLSLCRCYRSIIPNIRNFESQFSASANLAAATLGAGVLSIPFAFAKSGLLLGWILIFISTTVTIYSLDIIVRVSQGTNCYTYESIASNLGNGTNMMAARRWTEASVLIFCIGSNIAYIVAVGDISERILSLIRHEYAAYILPMFIDRNFIMILFWSFIMLPLSLLRRVDSLKYASIVGVSSVAILVFLAVIHSIRGITTSNVQQQQQHHQHHQRYAYSNNNEEIDINDDNDDDGPFQWFPSSILDLLRALPIFVFAFSCQPNMPAIYLELTLPQHSNNNNNNDDDDDHITMETTSSSSSSLFAESNEQADSIIQNNDNEEGKNPIPSSTTPTQQQQQPHEEHHQHHEQQQQQSIYIQQKQNTMFFLSRLSIILCSILYTMAGSFAYIDYGNKTSENILKNYCIEHPQDTYMIPAFLFMTLAIALAYPLSIFPARDALTVPYLYIKQLCLSGQEEEQEQEENENTVPLLLEDHHHHHHPTSEEEEENMESDEAFDIIQHIILTLFICTSTLLVALVVPNISVIFGLMGGTASALVCFILPGWFYLCYNKQQQIQTNQDNEENENGESENENDNDNDETLRWDFIWGWMLVIGGILFGILSTIVTIYESRLDSMDDTCPTTH